MKWEGCPPSLEGDAGSDQECPLPWSSTVAQGWAVWDLQPFLRVAGTCAAHALELPDESDKGRTEAVVERK